MCSAQAEADQLLVTSISSAHDEHFAFARCVSRLKEMQTKEYHDESAKKKNPNRHHPNVE